MKIRLLSFFFFFLLLSHASEAQSIVYQKDAMVHLIGRKANEPVIKKWLYHLGVYDANLLTATLRTYPHQGMQIGFYKGEWIDKIMLTDEGYSYRSYQFAAFRGNLPFELKFKDTRALVRKKLGEPQKALSTQWEYRVSGVRLLLFFKEKSKDSGIARILLLYDPCKEGDCENGEGTWISRSGTRYEGQWKNGKKHGNGRLTFASGKELSGVWHNGSYKGQNFFVENNLNDLLGLHASHNNVKALADKYKKSMRKFQLGYDYFKYVCENGKVKLYFDEAGRLYKIGIKKEAFSDFQSDWLGKLSLTSDKNYVRYLMGSPQRQEVDLAGQFWFYEREGMQIKMNFNPRDLIEYIEVEIPKDERLFKKLEGDCRTGDCQEGYGEFVTKVGRYVGDFHKGQMHGKGTLFYETGGKYEGQFEANFRHGEGTFNWKNGGTYQGAWVRDVRHGRGTMIYENGGRYEGHWNKGMRHGPGSMVFPNGDRFDGKWEDDKPQGYGILFLTNGETRKGMWENGVLVKPQ